MFVPTATAAVDSKGTNMRKLGLAVALGAVAAVLAAVSPTARAGLGNETVDYSYDALGRLTGSTITSGPNNGRKTGTCFDRAGNRMRYDVATSTPGACPTPSPTPTPAP
jgi:hypothetical protein